MVSGKLLKEMLMLQVCLFCKHKSIRNMNGRHYYEKLLPYFSNIVSKVYFKNDILRATCSTKLVDEHWHIE